MTFWKKKRGPAPVPACVQTARREEPSLEGRLPLRSTEHALYEQMRASVPIIDAALEKIVRLVGGFRLDCGDPEAERALRRFAETVPVGAGQAGMDAFLSRYLDDLLTYGSAVGEVVLDAAQEHVYALYNSPLDRLEVEEGGSPVELSLSVRDGLEVRTLEHPELILFSARTPASGQVRGISLLRGLPFISDILLRIYACIGKNFDRVGNVRFAVTYRPGDGGMDPAGAREAAEGIAREWSAAMSAAASGQVKDFVAVGDVDVKVIGADNQVIDTKIPVDQMLQQIVSRLGLPPFLLGLSWSTTERMSRQQADILTSELEAYRRLLTPVIQKICGLYLALEGYACEVHVEWDMINLQDELETAQAKLLLAQAAELDNTNKE